MKRQAIFLPFHNDPINAQVLLKCCIAVNLKKYLHMGVIQFAPPIYNMRT